MAEALSARLWLGRGLFALLVMVLLFIELVPLGFDAERAPRPDLPVALAFAVLLRRPDLAPLWLLAGLWFLADLLLQRPPGLWAALAVLAFEFARDREYRFREAMFPLEWGFVALLLFAAMLANRLILALTLTPLPALGTVMLHYFVTVLAYPAVVFFCYFILRIHKVTPDEAFRYGHRL